MVASTAPRKLIEDRRIRDGYQWLDDVSLMAQMSVPFGLIKNLKWIKPKKLRMKNDYEVSKNNYCKFH